jgi:hypothetical protein
MIPLLDFETYTMAGEYVSFVLIIAGFIVFLVLGLRTRSRSSFQFQMFLFALFLTASELPRILNTLGLISISSIEDTGLELHTVSMVVLTGFVGYRVYGFFRGNYAVVSVTGSMTDKISSTIQQTLKKQLGESSARAIEFYADSRLAASDPVMYSRLLGGILQAGAPTMDGALSGALSSEFGLKQEPPQTLVETLRVIMKRA